MQMTLLDPEPVLQSVSDAPSVTVYARVGVQVDGSCDTVMLNISGPVLARAADARRAASIAVANVAALLIPNVVSPCWRNAGPLPLL